MENLIFSLNATLPIFSLMILGYIFNKIGLIDEKAASWMNKFVFKVALPVLLFEDLATQDFAGTWNGKFVFFCFVITMVSIAGIYLLSRVLIKDTAKRGEQIVALLVMLGSATTVSCFIMAKSMGHEGTLSSSIIMMTTFGCSFSLAFWLFLLKTFGII